MKKIFPVFLPQSGCPFQCIYCDQEKITKTKYFSNNNHFTQNYLANLKKNISNFIHKNQNLKKEIAFFGGTFTKLEITTQKMFFDLVNDFQDQTTGIRISTRPDSVCEQTLDFCKQNKVTTIELGIQSFSDKVLKNSFRGYSANQAIETCTRIKNSEINLSIQLMPGLPGFDDNSLKETISNTISIKPDFVRIYPTLIIQGTELEQMYQSGKYTPLNLSEAVIISAKMNDEFSQHNIKVIKTGLHSDIALTENSIVAGPYHPAFGELVKRELIFRKILKVFEYNKTMHISPKDISLFKGLNGSLIGKLKKSFEIKKIAIIVDKNIRVGQVQFSSKKTNTNW